jgi:enamine deaminase RidA (YjgF/YER057c/UK114 family)
MLRQHRGDIKNLRSGRIMVERSRTQWSSGVCFFLAAALTATVALAEVKRIPAAGGEVILPTDGDVENYKEYSFAAVRRAGDTLYLSGLIVTRRKGEGNDTEAFKAQVRRAFERIKGRLAAGGASFDDVVMMRTFHVWESPNFQGKRDDHFNAFLAVKNEFMKEPHTAWTAVGTTGLLSDGGLVEIELVAHVPQKAAK